MSEKPIKDSYELMVPGEPHALSAIRWVVTRIAGGAGLPDSEIDKVELAVDEVCANVVEHGYGTLTKKPPIHIQIKVKKDEFVVEVTDHGQAFDFESQPVPDFPDHYLQGHDRGAGLFIIRHCMDEVSYEKLPNEQNRMRLVKKV